MILKNFLGKITIFRFYALFFWGLAGLCLFKWPIFAFDTDLFYHLAHGKYIFLNDSIQDKSYFSFISPSRDWVDYYWLFQVLVFKIYSWANYYGLVIFRAIIFLATALLLLFLIYDTKEKESFFYFSVVFSLTFLLLLSRFQLIRPHIFSYLFIISFLYIIECYPRKAFLLPILAILWCNLHGIEYPVLFLICLSYIFDFFISLLIKKERIQKKDFPYIFPLIISLATVYITPHGSKLIAIPFISTEYASQYIKELRYFNFYEFFNFQLSNPLLTIFNILLVLIIFSIIISIAHGKINISHLLLFAGGTFLLTKGFRFINEFTLLSIPLLRANLINFSFVQKSLRKKIIFVVFIIFCLSLPLILLKNQFQNRPKFPLSTVNLPTGITAFLNNLPISGSLLNHPNNGGYFIWSLYPKYKIFMDMEVPFLFTDEDFFMAANAFSNEEVLGKIIAKYSPSFISVPQNQKEFKDLIKKFPDFKPIFFDQAEVLYINQKHYPDIADKYKLNIDPFDLFGQTIEAMISLKGKEILLNDVLRLNKIYPECMMTNQILSMYFNKEGDYHSSIKYADRIIDNYPDAPMGYKLKGIALKNLKSYDEALSCFEKALERTSGEDKREIYKQIAYVYTQKQDYKNAYKFFKKGINVFSAKTTYQDLFDFSSAALLADRIDEAIFYLKLANNKVPPEDKKYKERIESQLARLGVLEKKW